MSFGKERFAGDVAAALAVLCVALIGFQYQTLAKLVVLPAGSTSWDLTTFVDTVLAAVTFDVFDAMLAALILVPLCYIAASEIKDGRLTRLLEWVFAADRRAIWSLVLTSLVSVRYYFAVGTLALAGDAPQHIAYLDIATEILSTGELPIWTNYFGTGSPFLQFYGFLYFLLTALLHLVLGDLDVSAKLFLGFCHALSGVGVYVLCRTLLGSRRAAFLAGLAYVLCFWHAQQILMMGRHPVGLVYLLLPWPFACLELARRSPSWLHLAIVGGTCHAALVLTHPGYGLYATGFLVFYIGLRAIEWHDRATLLRGAVIVGSGLVLSAPLTLPMMVERAATKLSGGWSLAGVDGPTLHHLLTWSNYRFWLVPLPPESRHWYGGYLGLSLILIACLGVVASIRMRTRLRRIPFVSISVATCVALAIPFAASSPWLQNVPLIPNFSGARYLLFASFFLSLSVGVGIRLLSVSPFGSGFPRGVTLALALVVVDLGPTTFQQPFGEAHPPGHRNPKLEPGELTNFRNFLTLRERNPYYAIGHTFMTMRIPIARAPHPGDLLTQSYFVEPLAEALGLALPESIQDLDWDQLSLFRNGLHLLNVRYVFIDGRHLERIAWHAPVVVSGKTVTLPEEDRLLHEAIASPEQREAIRAMRSDPAEADWVARYLRLAWTLQRSTVDTDRGAAAAIVIDSDASTDLGTDPESVVTEHRVWNTRATIRVQTTDRCFARLAYAYFPFLKVTVNGERVAPLLTAGRFIAVPLPEGDHVIELEAELSPLRKALWVFVGFLIAAWAIWYWLNKGGKSRFSGAESDLQTTAP